MLDEEVFLEEIMDELDAAQCTKSYIVRFTQACMTRLLAALIELFLNFNAF